MRVDSKRALNDLRPWQLTAGQGARCARRWPWRVARLDEWRARAPLHLHPGTRETVARLKAHSSPLRHTLHAAVRAQTLIRQAFWPGAEWPLGPAAHK